MARGKSTTYYVDTDPRNLINPETGELYDVQAGDCWFQTAQPATVDPTPNELDGYVGYYVYVLSEGSEDEPTYLLCTTDNEEDWKPLAQEVKTKTANWLPAFGWEYLQAPTSATAAECYLTEAKLLEVFASYNIDITGTDEADLCGRYIVDSIEWDARNGDDEAQKYAMLQTILASIRYVLDNRSLQAQTIFSLRATGLYLSTADKAEICFIRE